MNDGSDRKGLMSTLERLEHTAIRLTDLSRHSGEILHMISSPRAKPLPIPDSEKVISTDEGKSIVDLFDDVNASIEIAISKISSNLEELKLIIG